MINPKQPNSITIIYEDDDMLIINKPAGIRTHEDGYGQGETVSEWVANYYPSLKEVGEPMRLANGEMVVRSGIVHRLDRDTSGVMVLAKNKNAFYFLKNQFKNRQVEKIYWALVYGKVKGEEEKIIDLPIGRSNKDSRRRVASHKAAGKLRPAKTMYRALERFPNYTLVEAKPLTGRTHQIRVHLKAVGYPIVCDRLYAPGQICPPGLARQALHARSLSLLLPTGVFQTFSAPLPNDMAILLDKMRLA